MFLWPFELSKSAGLKVLHWLGQEHASYALGLFAPEAAGLAADDLTRLLGAVAHHTGAAAAILKAQQALEASARPEREEARRRRIPRLWLG